MKSEEQDENSSEPEALPDTPNEIEFSTGMEKEPDEIENNWEESNKEIPSDLNENIEEDIEVASEAEDKAVNELEQVDSESFEQEEEGISSFEETENTEVSENTEDGENLELIENTNSIWIDGEMVANFQKETTSSGTKLVLPIDSTSREIKIMGSHVIPEFGFLAISILSISIMSILFLTRSKLSMFR